MFLKHRNRAETAKRSSKGWNKFKRAAAGVLLLAGLLLSCGERNQDNFEPTTSFGVPDRSISVGEHFDFRYTVSNISTEKAKAVLFFIDVDETDIQSAMVNEFDTINGSGDAYFQIKGRHPGLFIAAAKLIEPRETEWTYEKVGVHPDIENPPEELLTFEVADWSSINDELVLLTPSEIEFPFSFGTIVLSLEEPRVIGETDNVFFYPAKSRDDHNIRAGIVVDETGSSGFITYTKNATRSFTGRSIQWRSHSDTESTIIHRDIDEDIIEAEREPITNMTTSTARCLPDDGIYRIKAYYDSTIELQQALILIEQAKVHIEPLGKNIEWEGPLLRPRLSPLGIDRTVFDGFFEREDMPFPGCRHSDFKIYLTSERIGAASGITTNMRGMVVLGTGIAHRGAEGLTHEIGHLFGSNHDCNEFYDNGFCYGIFGVPIFHFNCDNFDDLILQSACEALNITMDSPQPKFSIMFNYQQDERAGCVDGCGCSDELCHPDAMHELGFVINHVLGCISPTFSELSRCEIENTWEVCEDECESPQYSCQALTPEGEAYSYGFTDADFDGDFLAFEDGAGSEIRYINVLGGEQNAITVDSCPWELDGPRISSNKIVFRCCSSVCLYGIGDEVPDEIPESETWLSFDIDGNRMAYVDGPIPTMIGTYDVESGGTQEIEFPENYHSPGWVRFQGSRIASEMNNAETGEWDLWVHDLSTGLWQMDGDYRANSGYRFVLYGDRIAYYSDLLDERYVYDIRSGTTTRLELEGYEPSGRLDLWGDSLIFTSHGGSGIQLMNLSNGSVSDILNGFLGEGVTVNSSTPRISENRIVFASSDGRLYMCNIDE